jgi:hypothetical protein
MEDKKLAHKFSLPNELTQQIIKLAEVRGITPDQALAKCVQLGVFLESFNTGEVTVYVKQADGSDMKVYPVI